MGHIHTEAMRDEVIRELTGKHVEDMRALLGSGDAKALRDMANAVGERLSENKLMELLVSSAIHTGAMSSGYLFVAAMEECINAEALKKAVKEVERREVITKAVSKNFRPGAVGATINPTVP